MPATVSPYKLPTLPAYADPFRSAETALSMWRESWRLSAGAAVWWTEQWLRAPRAALAYWPAPVAVALRPVAKVIDLAEAVAARAAPEPVEPAAPEPEPAELALEAAPEPLSEAEPALDDLTRIVGIGPKLAAALAERGVTSFAQIAAWTDQEVAETDRALDLKGRATRSHWIAQAKQLAGLD